MSYYTLYKIGVYVSVWSLFQDRRGRGRTSKCQNKPNRKCQHFPVCNWLICTAFQGIGVSQGVEHYGEAQNVMTSCFYHQTGSTSTFLPSMDCSMQLSQEGGFSRWQTKWWKFKCENATNKLITSRKTLALPVWWVKQEVTTFWASP